LNSDLNAGDFLFINRHRFLADTNDLDYSRDDEDRQPVASVESTEQVTREQGQLDFLKAVGPAAP